MKSYKVLNLNLFTIISGILIIASLGFTSCQEDNIIVSEVDESMYLTNEENVSFVTNYERKSYFSTIEFRDEGKTGLILSLSKTAEEDVNASFNIDPSILQVYNEQNGTSYELFPTSLISFNNDVKILKGSKQSEVTDVIMQSNGLLSSDKTYVIPVNTVINSGNVKLSKNQSNHLIFVKDLSSIPTAEKDSGLKVISIIEANDTNPLNNLSFTLKDSGKPLIDMVVLFSSNINYNSETGRVYVFHNENMQHILDNREKYIKPLQDRGIKVILGVLGNHDQSGIASLADDTAREFAVELKNVVTAYKLDGVFFDDEYSSYQTPAPFGFVTPSSQAASRLFYETKMAMPDKLTCAYVYSRTSSLPDVDGFKSGEFVDFGIHDYLNSSDLSSNYPNMPKSNMILSSQEFNLNKYASASNIDKIVDQGYGGNMIFAMDPNRSNFNSRQLPAMEMLAEKFFNEELVYSETPFPKDW